MTKPNILFLVIDSFRADKFYGDKKTSITPNLDKLLENGVYFSQAVSSAPASLPAVSSILTGLYPFTTLSLEGKVYNLKRDIPTIGQKLETNGYKNFATIPKILTLMNLDHIFGSNIEFYEDELTLYDGVGEQILRTIDKIRSAEPWFYYIHLNDIHGQAVFNKEIIPEKFHDEKLGKNQYERMISLMDVWLGKIFEKLEFSNTLLMITADHSSDVGIFDDKLEELYSTSKKNRMVKKNSIIRLGQKIFSKSPESFRPIRTKLSNRYREKRDSIIEERRTPMLERIEETEDNVYRKRIMKNIVKGTAQVFDDRFMVPLLLCGWGIKKNRIIKQQVRSIDIYPTIFDILGYKIKDKIHGSSLVPLIDDINMEENPAFLESHINVIEGITSNTIGIRTSESKYFRNKDFSEKNVNLFDLKNDPFETENIAKSNKELVTNMEKLLVQIYNERFY